MGLQSSRGAQESLALRTAPASFLSPFCPWEAVEASTRSRAGIQAEKLLTKLPLKKVSVGGNSAFPTGRKSCVHMERDVFSLITAIALSGTIAILQDRNLFIYASTFISFHFLLVSH